MSGTGTFWSFRKHTNGENHLNGSRMVKRACQKQTIIHSWPQNSWDRQSLQAVRSQGTDSCVLYYFIPIGKNTFFSFSIKVRITLHLTSYLGAWRFSLAKTLVLVFAVVLSFFTFFSFLWWSISFSILSKCWFHSESSLSPCASVHLLSNLHVPFIQLQINTNRRD